MRQLIYHSLLLVVLVTSSCGKQEKVVSNFSTPEAAWETSFYATRERNVPLTFESLSREILATYGGNREEQLASIKRYWKDLKKDKKSRLEIIRAEYVDETHANVFYNHYYGSRLFDGDARVLMVKEDGKWKVALDENPFT